ncbi:MAG: translocation protein TolB [Cyclobacteriaceae bacterium]|nr:translocation protein TolB [Cyclobacteriaceae bacterium]
MRRIVLFSLIFLAFHVANAQMTIEQFGKNRLQYKMFDWRYLSSENFEVYYYDGGEDIAKQAAEFLEDEFERITDIIGYSPYTKTRIFLYNSPTDLKQSNVGVNENNFTVGGQTDFVKPQVEVAYPGTITGFKNELVFKISQMLINDMMFGGSLSDMFQSSYLLTLPDWFIDGAANYIAYGWNVALDDFMRDHFINENPRKLNKYTGEDAKMIGHSVWNFIAEKYGRSHIANILNLTRIIRNEEKSVANTLGMSFKSFVGDWLNFYNEISNYVLESYTAPDKENILIKNKRGKYFNQIRISPDGKSLAFTENKRGKYRVKIKGLEKGNTRKAYVGGYKVINQEIDYDLPLTSWIDNSNLAIISTKYGKNFVWFYNINSKSKQKKELTRLSNIKDFDVSESGNLAVISGDIEGQNDIFLISLRRNSIKRLTNDIYDDINPKFIPGTSAVIFSSNRPNDSLRVQRQVDVENINSIFNLYIYDVDTTRNLLYKVTNTLSNNTHPIPVSQTEFYYLSDQQGVNNIYKFDINKRIYTQVSNFRTGIREYDIGPNKEGLVVSMLNDMNTHVYHYPEFDFNGNQFTPQTRRQEIISAKYVAEKIRQRRESLKDSLNEAKTLEQNLIKELIRQRQDQLEENGQEIQEEELPPSGEFIDTDNYVFDRNVVQETQKQESFLSQYRKFRRESEIMGPFDYETLFSANNIVTSFVIDPLLGFGIQLETQMNDLLENHRFYGGILATTDLRSGNMFGEYQYLKYTIDFNVRYERKSLYRSAEQGSQKYTLNRFEMGASLPLNVTSRISIKPFYAVTRYFELDPLVLITPPPGTETSSTIHYGGFKSEFTFDNSVTTGLNFLEGTRGKIGYILYQGLNNPEKNFGNFYIDFRNYQKIHRSLIFATRFYYGRFFGPNQQKYLLGGLNNWLFNETNITGENDPLINLPLRDNSNQLFMEFLTPLRGFDYNKFNGSNALMANFELRFPIVRYFVNGPITSNFFRNLLFVGFFDIGSAWTGKSPFATENSVNTELIRNEGSPFQARIQNFKNPWLSSYGFGLRTVLLGYYMKFDMAYPIEDYDVLKPRFFVSLGYDF